MSDAVPASPRWRPRSVRVRLTLGYVVAVIVVLAIYAAGVFVLVSRNLSESLDQQLRGDFWWAAAMVDQELDGSITWSGDESVGNEEPLWLQVWSLDGHLLYRNVQAELNPVPESQTLVSPAAEDIVSVATENVPIRLLTRSLAATGRNLGRSEEIAIRPLVIQVARSENPMRLELRDLMLIMLFGLPVGVTVAGLSGYALARRALVPVERMAERARSITAERLSDRLPVDDPDDELGHLATVFNETLARLEGSFDQMRRFTADVSHELRTPLTAIRSVGEVGLRESRSSDAYRGIIGSMLEEVDRLAGLVDRLLTLSRVETGQAKLSLEPVDLLALAHEVVGHLGVLAEEKQQRIGVEGTGSPTVTVDRLMIRQALINLVDNAIKFTPEGGDIRVRLGTLNGRVVLDVTDSGPGIQAEVPTDVFGRFYREGGAAGTGARGAGLGLSIARWAVEVNGGTLTLEPGPTSGSTFRIALPKA